MTIEYLESIKLLGMKHYGFGPEEMKKMGEYAKEKAYSKYSMRQMVSNYCMAIEAAHQIVEKHDC